MSLEYAILGYLQYKPMSGYEIKKYIDHSIRHFWSADQSLIYRTLANLTAKSFIEFEVVIQDSRPNSKVYCITNLGREKFVNWLGEPIEKYDIRVSWLIQLFFASGLSDDKIIELLTGFLEQFDLVFKERSKNEIIKFTNNSRDQFFKDLTLDYGITVNKVVQEWIKTAIIRIKNKEWEKQEESYE